MNLTFQKISMKFLLAFTLFVGLFFCVDAVSAQECCLVQKQFIELSCANPFADNVYGPEVNHECKVIASESECNEGVVSMCISDSYYQLKAGVPTCCPVDEEKITTKIINCESNSKCREVLGNLSACGDRTETNCESGGACFWSTNLRGCYGVYDDKICGSLSQADCNRSEACTFNTLSNACDTKSGVFTETMYGGLGTGKILTRCAIRGDCKEINDILEVFINIGREIFKYIGAIAFVFFIYGGMAMILSFGSAEKFDKGRKILVAAVIGLIIAFSSYLIVNFILDALGVSGYYRVIK